jgi:hypothetical protein
MKLLRKLENLYNNIQDSFNVVQGPPELAEAVQFESNRNRPVHRWFPFKEGFSANIFTAAGIDTTALLNDDAVFLDPFCGCGTTLLAGDIDCKWHAFRIGYEVNPFLSFLARVKANWRKYDPDKLTNIIDELLFKPLSKSIPQTKWPSLSTFHNPAMIAPNKVSALVDIVDRVRGVEMPYKDLLLVGVAAAAEQVSYHRKDGRALRIIRSEQVLKQRKRLKLSSVLRNIWKSYEDDLRSLAPYREKANGKFLVLCQDGRSVELPFDIHIRPGDVTLMTYSPPYLNHIDYTEVYKVELWLLEFIKAKEEMQQLRKQTFRSHGSVKFDVRTPELTGEAARALEIATLKVIATGGQWHKQFTDLASTYFADMTQSLKRQYLLLRPGGRAVCVIGNSAHGSKRNRIPIATDLFTATIASSLGFKVEKFIIARQLCRRDHSNQFLRETILIFRRPA